MARLPQPGGDTGSWGTVLNEFLGVSLNSDGTLKESAIKSRGVTLTVGLANADRVLSSASDFATINTAIQNVSTAGGGTVVLRAGNYTPSDHIRLRSNVHLLAEDGARVTLAQGKGIVFGFGITNVMVEGLITDASNHVVNDKSYQLDATGDVWIYRCQLLNCKGFGIFTSTSGTNTAARLHIYKCRITGLGNNDLIGGGPLNSTGATVMEVIAEGNFVSQDSSQGNHYKFAFDMVGAYRLNFVNNTVEGGMIFGSEQSPHHHSIIQGNVIRNPNGVACAEVGFLVGSGMANPGTTVTIANNTIENGYIIASSSNVSPLFTNVIITGNNIDATGTSQGIGEAGIRTNNVEGVVISNNIVSNSTSHGIWLVNTTRVVVSGNVVRGSTLGGIKEDTGSGYNLITTNHLFGNTSANLAYLGTTSSAFNNGNVNPVVTYSPGTITTSPVTFRRSNGNVTQATLGIGNLDVVIASGDVKGDTLTLILIQDGSGNRTVNWPSNFKKAGGSLVLSTGAGQVDSITMVWDGTNWREISRALNMS